MIYVWPVVNAILAVIAIGSAGIVLWVMWDLVLGVRKR
jgi:hypothetical protein